MPPQSRFCPKGVGVRLADDGVRSSPDSTTSVTSDTPHAPVSLPLCARSPASKAPTGSAQNQNVRSLHSCFCPEGVGVRLADDGVRSSPDSTTSITSDTPHAPVSLPLCARSPASKAPTGSAQNQGVRSPHSGLRPKGLTPRSRLCPKGVMTLHSRFLPDGRNAAAIPLLPEGRRSPACRRWGAQQP